MGPEWGLTLPREAWSTKTKALTGPLCPARGPRALDSTCPPPLWATVCTRHQVPTRGGKGRGRTEWAPPRGRGKRGWGPSPCPPCMAFVRAVDGGAEPGLTDAPTEAPQNSATTGRSPAPSSAHRKQRGRPNQASQPSSQTDRSLRRRTPETQIPGHHRTGRPRQSARNPVSIHPDHGPAPRAPRWRRTSAR